MHSESGSCSYVKAGDDVVGVFFNGTGTMEYVSADAVETPVLTYMTEKDTQLSPEKTTRATRLRTIHEAPLAPGRGTMPELAGLEPGP